ncbi:N-acetyl-gamma-glutamyl-phosphate reductase [Haloactinospora alba]|uniref:N-acetyl-gamma-glutamyl-phosphate reductase n=1 Tax=Haloactinospora alba TaxID=405555 RepID=A0A543N979_9ACTN|nr:N-acetyl-gamma-glutamyl-phosphate reductase [Haloactinospora alba]TQN28367.1 N-acetyl-gamma-glutamyl-phosphate reductase [Haloactinospora alba]
MRVSVVGARGYVGGELVRLVLGHPELELVQATSRSCAGRPLGAVHPNLHHHSGVRFTAPEQLEPADAVLAAVPAGELAGVHQRLTSAARVVVDLSPDSRDPRTAPEPGYTLGMPELNRAALSGATRISVPGCMATAAVLALRPLVSAGLVDGEALVDARTGSSGAGTAPTTATHHPERQNALRVYRAAGHRHADEIARICGVRTRMTVTAVPLVRGVQAVVHARPPRPVSRAEVWDAYRACYAEEPFIRLVARRAGPHRLPDPQFLTGSNFADLGFDVDEDGARIVSVAALDNLMKGAAGGAVQSLNAASGIAERAGLEFPGLHAG